MNFLITNAYAAVPAANPQGSWESLWLLAGFVVLLYVMIWLPQNRRAKEHRQVINNLAKGDEVLTASGIFGKITKIEDDNVVIAIADNVEIRMQKSAISTSMPKGTLKSLN